MTEPTFQTEAQLIAALKHYKENPIEFIEKFGMVPDKLGRLVKFKASKAQRMVYNAWKRQFDAHKPVRICVVKCRQAKITTFVAYLGATLTLLNANFGYRCLTQREKAVSDVMKKIKTYIDNLPKALCPNIAKFNQDTIEFGRTKNSPGINSEIQCLVASGNGVGRGGTIQFLHSTEVDYWESDQDDVLSGIENSIINSHGTTRIVESTANGYNYLKSLVDLSACGINDYEIVFIPWYDIEEYTMNPAPGFEETMTLDERKMKDKFNLTLGQVAWYRDKLRNECKGNKNLMFRDFPSTLEEAFVSSGDSVFDVAKINQRLDQIAKSQRKGITGNMTYSFAGSAPYDWQFVPDDRGETSITIYQYPIPNRSYVIGVDTAGYGIDFTVAQVIDHVTGDQVAMFRTKVQEDLASQIIFCLGKYYNNAWIAVENNFSPFIITELQRFNYPNQYRTQVLDGSTYRYIDHFGFRTTAATRPQVVAELVKLFRDNIELVHDITTLHEARTFVQIKTITGTEKAQAIKGCHDDTLMALGIAQLVKDQMQPVKITSVETKPDKSPLSHFYSKF